MQLIDYRRVREAVSLADVLQTIDYMATRWTGERGYGDCPLGCGGGTRCCSFDLGKNLWFCHHCMEGGNPLDLFQKKYCYSLFQAAMHLCGMKGIEIPWIIE